MDESNNEVLTREKAIPEGVTPTGRKLGVFPVKGTALYEIKYVDNKPGSIPFEYDGFYTGLIHAQRDLDRFLGKLWDASDAVVEKRRKPLAQSNNNAVSR